jgi:hypothetical protein
MDRPFHEGLPQNSKYILAPEGDNLQKRGCPFRRVDTQLTYEGFSGDRKDLM